MNGGVCGDGGDGRGDGDGVEAGQTIAWWTGQTVMETSERVALEREWRQLYKRLRVAGVEARDAFQLLLDPCPTAVAAADIGDAMDHHAEAMAAAGLRSASHDGESQLETEAAQPIYARRRRRASHASAKFNHVLALRKRECLGTMNPYIFCRLYDVMTRECRARAQDDWPTALSDDDY